MVDSDQYFELETNTSGEAVGVMLSQGGCPIVFESKNLIFCQWNYSAYEREVFPIMRALKKWRQYLYGDTFTIATDHESLKWLTTQRELTRRKACWAEML